MEVKQHIESLRFSLEHEKGEQELVQVIQDRLAILRVGFQANKAQFKEADTRFLKGLNSICKHLQDFIELQEECKDLDDLTEYEEIVSRLAHVKAALTGLPVVVRVAKEMRELNERLPGIRDRDRNRRQSRLSARIVDLEQRTERRCEANHVMVIRSGRAGDYFWGCSRYPFCDQSARLTVEERQCLGL